ncbi:MAG: hypothetical protein ABI024_07080 [Vicinamibacterales bacterium]
MKTWHGSPVSMPDPAQLTRQIADEVTRFDRRVRRRNAREYVACVILLIWSVVGMMQGTPAAILLGAAALGVTGYRWWMHRHNRPLDAGTDARAYHAALIKRYDDQIALMTSAKYWYALPLYLPLIGLTWARWDADPQRAALVFATATAGFVVMWWLNEHFVVRKLKNVRAKAEAMFEVPD